MPRHLSTIALEKMEITPMKRLMKMKRMEVLIMTSCIGSQWYFTQGQAKGMQMASRYKAGY